MGDFSRSREGFRFAFLGMKTNASPDALPMGKYPFALNVRSYADDKLQTRPGLTRLFQAGASTTGSQRYPSDIRAYSALFTDDLPRILTRVSDDTIWLDTGTQVGLLAGSGTTFGAAMIPFRPNQASPPWMYIANGNDYQKFSAPDAFNNVVQRKVGIAEPQTPPDASASLHLFNPATFTASGFTHGGTAGAASTGSRVSDTIGQVLVDPTGQTITLQVSNASSYQQRMTLSVDSSAFRTIITDVFPPLPTPLNISGIFYFAGSSGRCIVVPANIGIGPGNKDVSIYTENVMATLRRGAMIKIGAEFCLVLSVSVGPDGTIAIETSTTLTHTTADTLTSVAAIQVLAFDNNQPGGIGIPTTGESLTAASSTYAVTTGVGTQSFPIAFNAFNLAGKGFQADDYISFGLLVDNLANLLEMKILFDVSDGTFTKDFYYYTVRAADLAQAVANTVTQLAAAQSVTQRAIIDEQAAIESANQGVTFSGAQTAPGNSIWTQITIPISELTRVGSDITKSIQNVVKFQFLWNASGTINVATDNAIGFFGGFQPDVGDAGAPLRYIVRPRDSRTGVIGNPSPATRYGVSSRREQVTVFLPSAAYDPQIDTWDIFRYGGAVTSFRYIGSTPSTNATFLDNYDDAAAQAGDALDYDNFEPWPSVDVPNNGTATQVAGTVAVVTSTDPDIVRYLPGTLVQLGGQNVYTLWARPTLISGTSYLLQFVENAGVAANVPFTIQEPLLARQFLPYMWGPDSAGTVFACGDPLHPGTLYFSKNYNPDSAPDTYHIELVQPSEPLLGGEIVDGLSVVGSTEHQWALYPTPDNPAQRYNPIPQPIPRGFASPYGHCNDSVSEYWWAKDGIWSSTKGSLTDADLYNLFPHEGAPGEAILYGGQVLPPPNYALAAQFRLTYSNGYLYAIYYDASGFPHVLVCRLDRVAWSIDAYSQFISSIYHVEQQVESANALNPILLMGGRTNNILHSTSSVYRQSVLTNDDIAAISCLVAVREFDGGDVRAPKQWGDFFLDLVPAASGALLAATPMSLGAAVVTPATTIPSSPSRVRVPVSVGGIVVSDFLGLLLQWTDDFTLQSVPTQLFVWQPSFDVQPARTIGWKSFGTSFNLQGFGHIRQIALAWVSTAPITLTITTFDGLDPQVIAIPSSGGLYQKQLFPLTANKGQLFVFAATSTAPFQIFEEDIEIHVGAWARQDAYKIFKSFGGANNAQSPI